MVYGKLIVIDGTDGAGKETQAKLLIERLEKEGHGTAYFDFPQHGKPSAAMVDEYLNGRFGSAKEVDPKIGSIFYAVDRYAASFDICQAQQEGRHCVSNRYVSANQGHQAGKIHDLKMRDEFLEWLDDLEFGLFKIPRPDINVLLYLPTHVGQKLVDNKAARSYINGQKRDIHEDDINHLNDAAEAFLYVAKKYNWIIIECAPNDVMRSREDIHEELWDSIKDKL